MQTRRALWIVAAFLLVAGTVAAVASAAAHAAPAVPSSTSDAAFVASLACGASPSAAPRIGTVPRPLPATTYCGTCSTSPCAGVIYNSPCNRFGAVGRCVSPLGDDCGDVLVPKCQCWFGEIE